MNCSSFSKGIYFVEVSNERENVVKEFMKE
jgi:hypothetical protein